MSSDRTKTDSHVLSPERARGLLYGAKAMRALLSRPLLVCLACGVAQLQAGDRGRLYVIGTGPAGPEMATMQALDAMQRMDAVAAQEDHLRIFAAHIGDKKALFDPLVGLWDLGGTPWEQLEAEQLPRFRAERARLVRERVLRIRALLDAGEDVGLLDIGNPSLYGPAHFYLELMEDHEVVIIPGMGSDAAAMAALGKSALPAFDSKYLIQTAPYSLLDGDDDADRRILEHMSLYPSTMVLYMALQDPEDLFRSLGDVLPADLPCAVVFWAGHPGRERIMRGTVADMGAKLAQDPERLMGLLFLGRFLEGKPYQGHLPSDDQHAMESVESPDQEVP